jgi:transcriptional regulator with XRE-family HTH domain
MQNMTTHWTEKSIDDFLYRIASDFVMQLEERIQSEPLSKVKLAENLGVSKGRVSQILNNPGNLTLKMIIKCARALGMKVAVVAYDDGDQTNQQGPINSVIFRSCWENSGKPLDFWSMTRPQYAIANTDLELPKIHHGAVYKAYSNVNMTWQGTAYIHFKEQLLDERTVTMLMTGMGVPNNTFYPNILEKEEVICNA